MNQSYPDLSALHHLQELRRATVTIAVYDEGEIVSFVLPGELVHAWVSVVGD